VLIWMVSIVELLK